MKDARICVDDAAFRRDRLQAALEKLRKRLAQLKYQEEHARRQVAYDKAEAVRDELANELADLYPAFAQKLVELLARVVLNDREIDHINNHALPKGADRLLVAELKARGLSGWFVNSVETPRITDQLQSATMAATLELSMATEKIVVQRPSIVLRGARTAWSRSTAAVAGIAIIVLRRS